MKKHSYIAIDIDGTLLDDHDTYDINRFNRAVTTLQQRGYHFIVASGNGYDALKEIFKNSPMVNNFVAENGGRIIINNKSVFEKHIQSKLFSRFLQN